jgi:pyruvyltransferase
MSLPNLAAIGKKINKKFDRIIGPISRDILYGIGALKGDFVLPVYWYDTVVNFGDLLTPTLLKKHDISPVWYPLDKAKIVVVGSILHILPENFSGFIVGAGLFKDVPIKFPHAKILAVRGNLTKSIIDAPASTVMGDPGLLADTLIETRQKKQFTLGIVPHYVDKSDERIQKIFDRYKNEILIIDVQRKPADVISDIDRCEHIISSSLHGMIVADSLGIPNTWTILSDKVRGGGFKFYDYASAFGMKYDPQYLTGNESMTELVSMTHKVAGGVPDIKHKLASVFSNLKHVLSQKQAQ